MYVRHEHMDDLYEGASAVVLAVVWVHYSARVFFFGACFALRCASATTRARDVVSCHRAGRDRCSRAGGRPWRSTFT